MLRKLALPAVLVMGIDAFALDIEAMRESESTKGLIGLEVGYIGSKYQYDTGNSDIEGNHIRQKIDSNSAAFGFKLGAESEEFRIFVDTRIWNSEKYNNGWTVGAALQYLIPLDEALNAFIGVNGGGVNVKNGQWDRYIGGDAGINYHLSDSMDFELGGRYSGTDVNSETMGKITSFYNGYVSIIYKFSTDQ